MKTFVLLRAVGDHRALMRTLAKEKHISRIFNITGDNDILIEVNSRNIEQLKEVLSRVRSTKGVITTVCYIVLARYK